MSILINCWWQTYGQKTYEFAIFLTHVMAGLSRTCRLCSYSYNSVRKKVDIIRMILKDCDILVLQETLLLAEDSYIIDIIDCNFDSIIMPSKCPASNEGRPSGGLAILCRRKLNFIVEIVSLHDNYMIVNIQFDSTSIVLINVYLPVDQKDIESSIEDSQTIGEIKASISDLSTDDVICLGDFNADPMRGPFWKHVEDFSSQCSLRVVDNMLPADTFAFFSPCHNSTSWLEDALCGMKISVRSVKIRHDLSVYDHFPFVVEIDL